MSPEARRRLMVLSAAAAAAAGLLFLLTALAAGDAPVRARKALTFAVIAEALAAALAPLFAAERVSGPGWLRAAAAAALPVGWVFCAALPGEGLLALGLDRGALGAVLLAKLVAAAAGLASAGLVLALARLARRPALAAALAAALVLAVALGPFFTLTAIRNLSHRPAARDRLIAAGLRSPPLAAAYALAGAARPVGWGYVPHTSPWFYDHWVGTDYALAVPSPRRYLGEYLMVALVLGAVAALRRSPAGSVAAEPAPGAAPGNSKPASS